MKTPFDQMIKNYIINTLLFNEDKVYLYDVRNFVANYFISNYLDLFVSNKHTFLSRDLGEVITEHIVELLKECEADGDIFVDGPLIMNHENFILKPRLYVFWNRYIHSQP